MRNKIKNARGLRLRRTRISLLSSLSNLLRERDLHFTSD